MLCRLSPRSSVLKIVAIYKAAWLRHGYGTARRRVTVPRWSPGAREDDGTIILVVACAN